MPTTAALLQEGRRPRRLTLVTVLALLGGVVGLAQPTARATFPGGNGKLAFSLGAADVQTVNPDGTGQTDVTPSSGSSGDDLNPAWSPDGQQIVFSSDRDGGGDSEIFVMSSDGSNITQLTDNAVDDSYPSFNHDGTRIVFVQDGSVAIMDANGDNLTVLSSYGTSAAHPKFSPDDTKIAYSSVNQDAGADRNIQVIDADGQNHYDLSNDAGPSDDDFPSWSPNGSQVAFMSARDFYCLACWDIYVRNADNSGTTTRLTSYNDVGFNQIAPSWGANGRIAFVKRDSGGNPTIWTMASNGTDRVELRFGFTPAISPDGSRIAYQYSAATKDIFTMDAADGSDAVRLTPDPTYHMTPDWSSDGTRLAMQQYDAGGWDIVTTDATGSDPVVVTSGAHDEQDPSWSPDSAWIAYDDDAARFDGGRTVIYKIHADGSNPTPLTGSGTGNDIQPAWSPDGSKIAFISVPDDSTCELWVMDANGDNATLVYGSTGQCEFDPTWSPDGTKIAFTSNRFSAPGTAVVNPDGSGFAQLTTVSGGSYDLQPAWSPDGTQIAFVRVNCNSGCQYALDRLDVANPANVTQVVPVDGLAEPSWQPVPVTDDQPPTVTVSFSPAATGWFTTSPATGSVSADDTDTGGSNVTTIHCTGATVGTITGAGTPSASAPITVSAPGSTDVTCYATDSAGQDGSTGTANTATVKLDAVNPSVAITSVSTSADGFMPAQSFTSPGSTFPVTIGALTATVSGTASDATSGISSVTVNGAATTGTLPSWSKSGLALSGDGNTAAALATDVAGNTASASAATVHLDLDGDGIANNIDGNSTVSPAVSNFNTPSTRFSDKLRGGSTSGQIKSLLAGAVATIADVSPGGVFVAVTGSGQGKFTLDGKAGTTTIPAGGTGTLTDPPGTTELSMIVGTGQIEYVINGQTEVVDVFEGSTADVTEVYTNGVLTGLNVTEPAGDPGGVTVNGTAAGDASFSGKLTLSASSLDLSGTLTLLSGSPSMPQALQLKVGSFAATVPSTAFKKNKQGWAFTQPVGPVTLTGLITTSSKSYTVKVSGTGANGVTRANPVTVTVKIGPDAGTTTLTAKFA